MTYKIYYKKKNVSYNFIVKADSVQEIRAKTTEQLQKLKLDVHVNNVHSVKIKE